MTFNIGSQQENTENPSVNSKYGAMVLVSVLWWWVVVVLSGSTASMTELS